jgi:hypothetical protein
MWYEELRVYVLHAFSSFIHTDVAGRTAAESVHIIPAFYYSESKICYSALQQSE